MTKDDDKKVDAIICTRVVDRATPIDGSTKEHCSKCGSEVWITPKTLEVKNGTGAGIVCIPCILPQLEKDPLFYVTPGQVEEASDHIKKEIQKN